jgi:hypothetical protein
MMAFCARPAVGERPTKPDFEGNSDVVIRRDLWQD